MKIKYQNYTLIKITQCLFLFLSFYKISFIARSIFTISNSSEKLSVAEVLDHPKL